MAALLTSACIDSAELICSHLAAIQIVILGPALRGLEPQAAGFGQQGGFLRLDPVGDGDVDVGLAATRAGCRRLRRSCRSAHDVVEAADAGVVVADVLRADQSGAAGDRVLRGARRQVVVGAAEPVDAVVGHARHVGVGAADGVDVVGAESGLSSLAPRNGGLPMMTSALGQWRGLPSA